MEINTDKLKAVLKLKGYSFPDLTDDEFNNIKEYYQDYILSEIGATLEETDHEDVDLFNELNSGYYLFQYYPVSSVTSIVITNENEHYNLTEEDYDLDKEDGIIKFHKFYDTGKIIVKYKSCLSKFILLQIESLIFDMFVYNSTPATERGVSSIHEGDVSISFDMSTNLGASINTRIENLKNIVSARVQML